jgi:hypothetical protein
MTSIFGPPAHVFVKSTEMLLKWKSSWINGRKSEMRKAMRALHPIKVRFGSNFVDKSTTFVIQDTTTRTTVSSLLMSE